MFLLLFWILWFNSNFIFFFLFSIKFFFHKYLVVSSHYLIFEFSGLIQNSIFPTFNHSQYFFINMVNILYYYPKYGISSLLFFYFKCTSYYYFSFIYPGWRFLLGCTVAHNFFFFDIGFWPSSVIITSVPFCGDVWY